MQITTAKDISKLGTILSVWAHPDDETFSAAGILYTARRNGQSVCCVTATRGELGVQDESRWPAQKLGDIRQAEMEKTLKILGINCHHWLGYKDGSCATANSTEAVDKLIAIIEHIQPDTILTFGPSGTTGHTDHIAVSNWTSKAIAGAQTSKPIALYHAAISRAQHQRSGKALDEQFDIYFNTNEPPLVDEAKMDICYHLTPYACEAKLAAMRAQASQTTTLLEQAPPEYIRDFCACEGFVRAR